MKKMIMGGVLAAALAAGAATAAPDRAARMDSNGDGVSVAEMQRHMAERFQRLDANRDGQLTKTEFASARDKFAERRGNRGDRAQKAGRRFERLDANRDGQVSRSEFDAARAQRAERRGGERRGGRRGGERMFAHVDADNNGVVTLAEFTRRAGDRVARLDANKDGRVSSAEFAAVRGGKGGRRQAD